MEETDHRFATISSDPRFKHIPKRMRKVKIDRRFEAMFKDKKFKLKYTIDKRGRPINQSTDENLKRFYEMSDSESEPSEGEEEETRTKQESVFTENADESCDDPNDIRSNERTCIQEMKRTRRVPVDSATQQKMKRRSGREEIQLWLQKKKSQTSKTNSNMRNTQGEVVNTGISEGEAGSCDEESIAGEEEIPEKTTVKVDKNKEEDSSSSSSDDSSEEDGDIHGSSRVDYSRGKALMESSSSDESDSEGNENVDVEHEWGELDTAAMRGEDTSSRLAVCNMDWDRITAQDIFAILSSFKPSAGVIRSVKIYISDLGLERMKDEDIHGPKELVEKDDKFDNLGKLAEKKYFREKLRKYQLQRLKYFYATVECDSQRTATYIYEQCDGYEFESSAIKMDLRFIPDDITFDRDPKDVADSDSINVELYKPSDFVNSALQQSNVNLTWDEDDPGRIKNTQGAFKKEVEVMDINAYVASSSEDDDKIVSDDEDNTSHMTEEERLQKYRMLVRDLDKEKEDEDVDNEMKITWESGLKETTEDLVDKKLDKVTEQSPWQQFLDRKKGKKKEKRDEERKIKEKSLQQQRDGSDGDVAFSDDDLPEGIDLNDPYFSTTDSKKKRKNKQEEEDDQGEEDPDLLKKRAELELMMMDDDDQKQHFNLKDIMEQEKPKKKKKRRKKTTEADEENKMKDNFEVDVKDTRFDAIYSSHHFAIDPSDPQYKKTKAMQAIMDEKQTRRAQGGHIKPQTMKKSITEDVSSVSKSEVSALIKTIKKNTNSMKVKGKSNIINK